MVPFLYVQGSGIDFSAKEKAVIYTNAIKVLENYQTIVNSIGQNVVADVEKAKSNSEGLLELFVNRQVLLYNDLDPAHKLSEFYEAETYASNLILWYPDGINVNLDFANAKVSDIMTHDDNVYSIDVMLTKSINGNYLNQTMNKNREELTFRIAFGVEDKNITNFRIVGVRSAASMSVVDFSKALREVNSEDLNSDDLNKIYSEIKAVLMDYSNFLALLGDPQETAEDKEFYKESFRKLFHNPETKLYNDIAPQPETSLISVEDYLKNYLSEYPNGIKNLKINADSAKFGKVMKNENGKGYFTYVDANKFFSGSYKGKEVFRKMFPLVFKIYFNESGKTFSDFSINSIDVTGVNFFEDTPEGKLEKKPSITISPVTRKGWTVSFNAVAGMTGISSKNIDALTLATDSVQWNTSLNYGYDGGIGLSYYFNDNMAIRAGLEFTKYSAKYSLSGKFTDNVLTKEPLNPTLFYKVIEADYDSLVTVNYLTLPVLFSYTGGKPGQLAFFAEAGVKVSLPVKASYRLKGNYSYYGDYPSAPLGNRYDYIADKGFYSKTDLNETKSVSLPGINLLFSASAGVSVPLGYYNSVIIGPEVNIGLTDVTGSQKIYKDVFGKVHDHKPVKVNSFGLRIAFAYKL
jgi:hypothetical protein